jgi:hypothetical protein
MTTTKPTMQKWNCHKWSQREASFVSKSEELSQHEDTDVKSFIILVEKQGNEINLFYGFLSNAVSISDYTGKDEEGKQS